MNHWGEKRQVRVWRHMTVILAHYKSRVWWNTDHLGNCIPTIIYNALPLKA